MKDAMLERGDNVCGEVVRVKEYNLDVGSALAVLLGWVGLALQTSRDPKRQRRYSGTLYFLLGLI